MPAPGRITVDEGRSVPIFAPLPGRVEVVNVQLGQEVKPGDKLLALRSMLPPGYTHRTAQLGVHFLSKGEGTKIIGRGRSLHLGQRMGYGESEVLDGSGQLLARASGTFIVLPAPGAF